MVSEKALKEFIDIYREEFGIELEEEKALEMAINLLNLFNNIYRPIKRNWLDELK